MHATREAWLRQAAEMIELEFFRPLNLQLPPKWGISCGFCGNSKAIGICVSPDCAADGTVHMFICPRLDDPVKVMETVAHEMVHAIVGLEHKHGGEFRRVATTIGLTGRMTATRASEEMVLRLAPMVTVLGPYPHKALVRRRKAKPTNGWERYRSVNSDTYKVTVSPIQVEEHGAPRDPWGDEMVPVKDDKKVVPRQLKLKDEDE
jgi:hypothetical protein